jgi:hypothetical protein
MERARNFAAECFWPDVDETELVALEQRVQQVAAEMAPTNNVRYLGSVLLCDDEVVLCQFEGNAEAVRELAERARIPFERILATANSPWKPPLSRSARAGESAALSQSARPRRKKR